MQSCPLRRVSHYLGFKSAGVAPLPPCFRKLLDETVLTVAVFPSCLHLLDCDDNSMMSVPLSTSDFHCSRWQSGEICQWLSTGAITLLCHVLLTSMKVCPFFGLTLRSSAPVCCKEYTSYYRKTDYENCITTA